MAYLFGQLLFDPLPYALALIALSYALRSRLPRASAWLPAIAFAILFVLGTPATANALQHALEAPVPPAMDPGVTYDAVIVLGGTMDGPATLDTGEPQYLETVERVLAAFDILRTGRARYAIVSGTWAEGRDAPEPESRLIARQLAAWGIDPARIVTDEASHNTHENALESVRLARERGWLRDVLVTSASHMMRARGCFAKLGLEVDTRQVDYVTGDPARHRQAWFPRTPALRESVGAIRERLARLVYGLRGWT